MSEAYMNESQQRILRLISTLSGNEVDGLAPSHIARLQGCSASVVTRDLANLRAAGFAEQVPHNGQWRLSPQLVQIAVRLQLALDQAQQRLHESRSRFTRA